MDTGRAGALHGGSIPPLGLEQEGFLFLKNTQEVVMGILMGIVIGLLAIIAYRLDVLNHNLKKYTRIQNTTKESSGNKWLDMARERMGND